MGRAALIVVGVSVGVLLGIGAQEWFGDDSAPSVSGPETVSTSFPPVTHDRGSARDLLAAWGRWRTSTFYARGTWERRLDSGGDPLRGPVLTVQDPPRRVVIRLGALLESTDGSVRSCDSEVGGQLSPACIASAGGIGHDERVAAELAVVEGYVTGAARAFDVGPGSRSGCYRAESRTFAAAAPWGLWAEFCFDADTGAMVMARILRDSAVDTEVMIEVRSELTAADFALG